jgi:hypothetical protein
MKRAIAALGLCLGGCVAAAGAVAADVEPRACKSNPTMTLSDYLARGVDQTWPDGKVDKKLPDGEYRMLVPRDLKIESGLKHYYASDGAASGFPVPIDDGTWWSNAGIRFLGEIISPCRVQDPTGRWWVIQNGFNDLEYFSTDKVQEMLPERKK